MSWKKVALGCMFGLLALVPSAFGQAGTTSAADVQSFINDITAPAPGVKWGLDVRVREEYARNCFDVDDVALYDDSNVFRFRNRLWMELGPFLSVEGPGAVPNNGVSFYVRLVYEPYVYTVRPDVPAVRPTMWNELALDNLYVNLDHFMNMPVSLKVGRQDMMYGHGLVMAEGTPFDGSRTIFFDAIKATLHLDPLVTNVDVFYANNKARESRVEPLNVQSGPYLSEYNIDIFGVYAINKMAPGHEFHGYWIYHHDKLIMPNKPTLPKDKKINTAGALAQGKFAKSFDYYVEAAGQWGRQDGQPFGDAWAFSSDFGYTVEGTEATPVRVHAGYEYLSGNDAGAARGHGWDSSLSRFPRFSELYTRLWTRETGMVGFETNLQRYIAGASYKPVPELEFVFDYNLLLQNNATVVPGFMTGKGDTRGNLFMGKAFYKITPYLGSHLWAECFLPSRVYTSNADPAWFLRWELTFTLANQQKKK